MCSPTSTPIERNRVKFPGSPDVESAFPPFEYKPSTKKPSSQNKMGKFNLCLFAHGTRERPHFHPTGSRVDASFAGRENCAQPKMRKRPRLANRGVLLSCKRCCEQVNNSQPITRRTRAPLQMVRSWLLPGPLIRRHQNSIMQLATALCFGAIYVWTVGLLPAGKWLPPFAQFPAAECITGRTKINN